MGYVRKVLGQVAAAATTDTTLYTVPASTTAVISRLFICNRTPATPADVRVWIRVNGVATDNKQYIVYDLTVTDTYILTGLTLGAGDIIMVRSSTANVSFSVFGEEAS